MKFAFQKSIFKENQNYQLIIISFYLSNIFNEYDFIPIFFYYYISFKELNYYDY